MLVGEVMTRNVVTVAPETTIVEVANLFSEKNISGAPVVGQRDIVIGVISEADLLHRTEIGTERRHSWLSRLFKSDQSLAQDFIHQGARKVADVMSTNLIVVDESAGLALAAELMGKHKVKRLVVLQGKKLAGIITRADIVSALAASSKIKPGGLHVTSDEDLRQSLSDQLIQETWAKAQFVNTHVHNGVVELSGFVNSESQKNAIRVLAENLPGVKTVRDRVQVYTAPIDAT